MDLAGTRGSGAHSHGTTTRSAGGKSSQQHRASDDPRRGHTRIVLLERGLHRVEFSPLDDCRNFDDNPLIDGLLALSPRLAFVESPLPDVDVVGQDRMDRGDTEARSLTSAIAPLVPPCRFRSLRSRVW